MKFSSLFNSQFHLSYFIISSLNPWHPTLICVSVWIEWSLLCWNVERCLLSRMLTEMLDWMMLEMIDWMMLEMLDWLMLEMLDWMMLEMLWLIEWCWVECWMNAELKELCLTKNLWARWLDYRKRDRARNCLMLADPTTRKRDRTRFLTRIKAAISWKTCSRNKLTDLSIRDTQRSICVMLESNEVFFSHRQWRFQKTAS